jgi:serine/threonine protein kinase
MAKHLSVDPRRYIGSLLTGGLRLDRLIGIGGFAAVYHARRFDGTEAAVKVLLTDEDQAAKRFIREIKVMASLPHSPHLVRSLGHGVTPEGHPFLVMELVDGPTLIRGLQRQSKLPQDEAAVVLYQIALALQSLHRYGIVHRDVKPNNVLMSPDGLIKLFDFGLVLDAEGMLKLFEEEDILSGRDFAEDIERGAIAGTPEYMAPEQFSAAVAQGGDHCLVGPATDVFSAGVILYRLLTGVLPFPMQRGTRSVTTTDVLAYLKARARELERGIDRPEGIDEALWSILVRAMANDPAERQPNSQTLAKDLFGYLTLGTGTRLQDAPPTQIVSGYRTVSRPSSAPSSQEVFLKLGASRGGAQGAGAR